MGPRPTATAEQVAAAPDATTLLLLDAARSDQQNFEAFRRSTLPLAPPMLSGSFTCTESVGLFCIDRVMGGLARVSSPDDPGVVLARIDLIESLQAANQRMPGDGWVQGQLIRYLVESGNFATASASAANCRVVPAWWCLALAGYVYHHSGYGGIAEEAFRAALGSMPAEERVHWLDISPLLDADAVTEYALLESEEAARFEESFWLLADPLITQPGHEIFNEHLARRVELNLQLEAESIEGPLGDRDPLETIGRYDLLLRYGLPTHWIRGLGSSGMVQIMSRTESPICFAGPCGGVNYIYWVQGQESGALAHVRGSYEARRAPDIGPGTGLLAPPEGIRDLIATYEVPPQDFLPPPGFLLAGGSEDEGEDEGTAGGKWDVIREVPQTAYSLRMEGGEARWIAPLEHQVAVFPRGDSAIVVGGWDLSAHGVSASAQVDAGIALLEREDLLRPATVTVTGAAPASGALMAKVAARPALISVEAAVPAERTMARARIEVDLVPLAPLRFAISDLLLLRGGEEDVNSLDDAVGIAKGSARAIPGELLGVYWELFGLDPVSQPEVTMSLTLRRPPSGVVGGALQWLGQTIGVASASDPVRTEWVEEVVPGPWMGRSLNVRIPEIAEGSYFLVLTATIAGREPVMAVREIEVSTSAVAPPTYGRLIRRPNLTRPTRCLPETPITASAFSIADARDYLRTPRCMFTPDPSWFGHYGGTEDLREYGYEGW